MNSLNTLNEYIDSVTKLILNHVNSCLFLNAQKNRVNTIILSNDSLENDLLAYAIYNNSEERKRPLISINCEKFLNQKFDDNFLNEIEDNSVLYLSEVDKLNIYNQIKFVEMFDPIKSFLFSKIKKRMKKMKKISSSSSSTIFDKKIENLNTDFYKLISKNKIIIPSLDSRREDILKLINICIKRFNSIYNKNIVNIDTGFQRELSNINKDIGYSELEKYVERAVILSSNDVLKLEFFLDKITQNNCNNDHPDDLKLSLHKFEKKHIKIILDREENDKVKCAKALNIGLSSLYRKIEELDIEN